jgi:hypothetical protein
MRNWLIIMAALFLADGVATAILVEHGVASEVNPLLRMLVHASPWSLLWVKLGVLAAVLPILWRYRERKMARRTVIPTTVGYALLCGWHIYCLTLLGMPVL